MPANNKHATLGMSARSMLGGRISRHPERYMEIMRILRKYDLQHVVAELGLVHRHVEEDVTHLLAERDDHELRHARGLASALEELGPCFIKLGQLLSTRPDVLPASYIEALARLQDTITPVPADKIEQIIEN